MAAPVPKTKAGKEAKVARVMGEFKKGDLSSSSGAPVSNPKQAIAIALNQAGRPGQSGQAKPAPAKPKARQANGANSTARLSRRLDQRLDQRMNR